MIIENRIADGIDFFHMDALSSAVAMKVNCDLQLTLMASSLYRLLAGRIGRGYEQAESRHLFQDFVNATAQVKMTKSDIVVRCIRSVPITPCSSQPVSIRQRRSSPGWGASGCGSYSGSLTLSPREERGVKSKTKVVGMLVSLCVLAIC
jgi:hypothetical protein